MTSRAGYKSLSDPKCTKTTVVISLLVVLAIACIAWAVVFTVLWSEATSAPLVTDRQ